MTNAFVLINCDEDHEENIVSNLRKIKNVEYVQKTIGAYDLVIKVNAENASKLKETIKNKIKEIQDIHHTLTLVEPVRE